MRRGGAPPWASHLRSVAGDLVTGGVMGGGCARTATTPGRSDISAVIAMRRGCRSPTRDEQIAEPGTISCKCLQDKIMPSRHQPIQFSGDVAALAHTLAMPVGEIIAALDALIQAAHLEQIGGNTWLLRPAR
jgi:hypothetical protein